MATKEFENFLMQIQRSGQAQAPLRALQGAGKLGTQISGDMDARKKQRSSLYANMVKEGYELKDKTQENFQRMINGEEVEMIKSPNAVVPPDFNLSSMTKDGKTYKKEEEKVVPAPWQIKQLKVQGFDVPEGVKFTKKWLEQNVVPITGSGAARIELQDRKDMASLEKAMSPLTQTGRNVIGVAGQNNVRAYRLLVTMNDENATQQDINIAIADVAAIYKGGVPDQELMRDAGYKTLKGKLANLLTYVTSKPAAAKTPAVREKILKLTHELIAVDNEMIRRNMGSKYLAFAPILAKLQKGEVRYMSQSSQSEWWDSLSKSIKATIEDPVVGNKQPTGGGLTPDEEARYQELLRKSGGQ